MRREGTPPVATAGRAGGRLERAALTTPTMRTGTSRWRWRTSSARCARVLDPSRSSVQHRPAICLGRLSSGRPSSPTVNNQPIRCRGCRLRIKPPTIAPVAAVKVSSGKPMVQRIRPHNDMPPRPAAPAARHKPERSAGRTDGSPRISPRPPAPGAGRGSQPRTDVPAGRRGPQRVHRPIRDGRAGSVFRRPHVLPDVEPMSVIDRLKQMWSRAPDR